MIWQILGYVANSILFLIVLLLVVGVLLAVGYIAFLPLAYIGTSLSVIPLEVQRDKLKWRGRTIKKMDEDKMAAGAAIVWILVVLSVLAGVGYVLELVGVSFV